MLPKERRLIKEQDFKRVYRKGSFFSASLFNVNFAQNRTSLSRIGVVISKKVAGKAVARNRAKRQMREMVRKYYDKLPQGFDVIINIKEKALKSDTASLEKEILSAFERVGK